MGTHDANLFYERSLGAVGNDGYQLTLASQAGNNLAATYDAAGYMTEMTMARSGSCAPAGKCAAQRYRYERDEVVRLTRARRWDQSNPVLPADAELLYAYDSSDQRAGGITSVGGGSSVGAVISKDGVTRTATVENATGLGDDVGVIGASAGVSFSVGVSWDKDQCVGTGKSAGLSTPALGVDFMKTDDGRVHGVQLSWGPGIGVDLHVTKQWTVAWSPEQLRGTGGDQKPRPLFQLPEIDVRPPDFRDVAKTEVVDRLVQSPSSKAAPETAVPEQSTSDQN